MPLVKACRQQMSEACWELMHEKQVAENIISFCTEDTSCCTEAKHNNADHMCM